MSQFRMLVNVGSFCFATTKSELVVAQSLVDARVFRELKRKELGMTIAAARTSYHDAINISF